LGGRREGEEAPIDIKVMRNLGITPGGKTSLEKGRERRNRNKK